MIGRRTGGVAALEAENVALRAVLVEVRTSLDALASGDLEHRAGPLPEVDGIDTRGLRSSFNHAVDIVDGFVRETGSVLTAAAQGRHERLLLGRGLPGAFRRCAGLIDVARQILTDRDAEIDRTTTLRSTLVADFERDVLGNVHQVRETAGDVSGLVAALGDAVGTLEHDTAQAASAVEHLATSSAAIGDVVRLITTVAAQTRLLALNATIEAARAGDSGRSFAVVADEVRRLSDETARASGRVAEILDSSRASIVDVTAALAEIEASVVGMRSGTEGVRARTTGSDEASLASASSRLDGRVDNFLRELRG